MLPAPYHAFPDRNRAWPIHWPVGSNQPRNPSWTPARTVGIGRSAKFANVRFPSARPAATDRLRTATNVAVRPGTDIQRARRERSFISKETTGPTFVSQPRRERTGFVAVAAPWTVWAPS